MGYGACASVLIPIGNFFEISTKTEPVGVVVDNVECEVAGIKVALQHMTEYVVNKIPNN